jgi:hypothetical protein
MAYLMHRHRDACHGRAGENGRRFRMAMDTRSWVVFSALGEAKMVT